MIIRNKECSSKLINITNACIDLSHWPSHFKMSTMIIISKPNKLSYNSPKSFCPIVLLNKLGKLFKKIIGERLQFHSISNNFVHSCQLGRLKHRSATDTEITLTYFIWSGWVRNLTTSMLAFDLAQVFPSLNHQLLPLILDKAGFVLWIKTKRVKSRNNSCIGVTQENSIEFLIQSSLPYILLPMVRASYYAPYPKWPWA